MIAGIPDLRVFADPYIEIELDREKGRKVAERAADLDFRALVDFYYSITSVVPPQHAQQYTRGLLGAVARSESALEAWADRAGRGGLLDLGCGTAPLLVAAAGRGFAPLVGVDIAFRWLVVGRKRLIEAGLDLPLVCACAEALPFPDQQFDFVTAESVLENVRNQHTALTEANRVLRPGGHLFLATPNRLSLGPDPHVGLWAAGYLPNRWVAAHVLRQGGIPPKRKLLSHRALVRAIGAAGFEQPRVFLPDIAAGVRQHLSPLLKRIVAVYHAAKRLPISRHLLFMFGPLLYAVAKRPSAAGDRRGATGTFAAEPGTEQPRLSLPPGG